MPTGPGELVSLGFNDCQGEVGLVIQNKVGATDSAVRLYIDDDAAFGKADSLAHVPVHIPPGALYGGGNVFTADVPFGKRLLVHDPVLDGAITCAWSRNGRRSGLTTIRSRSGYSLERAELGHP
jgi:hypothetical protein